MFTPAKSDLINDEQHVSDIQPISNVITLHPTMTPQSTDKSSDISSDITSENRITVADFCSQHSITSEQFLALRRKAARKNPGLDFKPVREGSRTFWVQQSALLTEMIEQGAIEPKKVESKSAESAIDGEIVEEKELSDGSSLVVRRQSFELALPPLEAPKTREFAQIDIAPIQRVTESLRADLVAESEARQTVELAQHAQKVAQRKAQFDLVEMLIEKGYTPEQAVQIAQGANNLPGK